VNSAQLTQVAVTNMTAAKQKHINNLLRSKKETWLFLNSVHTGGA